MSKFLFLTASNYYVYAYVVTAETYEAAEQKLVNEQLSPGENIKDWRQIDGDETQMISLDTDEIED